MTIRKTNSGFSLIELMTVVAIVGVLTGIAVPQFQPYLDRIKNLQTIPIDDNYLN
ncbi:type IV pilin protein [Candidatus Nitrosacidococcus sp. I8]|uniref:type IV pilin protein n=1 Tax=Candidatus Nitrosacidococcus sp. I8 TaxID=2942908 RepID=UPI0024C74CBB|nr:prepilin-type N-terminal cleavage/methylation domain-containing protein [Candidatus Nitrosacidococcus sp. I8]CAH9019398.1 hypothetical protein NURINAE_01526 [Candidatus Nitrosacidococcus sp. I8]